MQKSKVTYLVSCMALSGLALSVEAADDVSASIPSGSQDRVKVEVQPAVKTDARIQEALRPEETVPGGRKEPTDARGAGYAPRQPGSVVGDAVPEVERRDQGSRVTRGSAGLVEDSIQDKGGVGRAGVLRDSYPLGEPSGPGVGTTTQHGLSSEEIRQQEDAEHAARKAAAVTEVHADRTHDAGKTEADRHRESIDELRAGVTVFGLDVAAHEADSEASAEEAASDTEASAQQAAADEEMTFTEEEGTTVDTETGETSTGGVTDEPCPEGDEDCNSGGRTSGLDDAEGSGPRSCEEPAADCKDAGPGGGNSTLRIAEGTGSGPVDPARVQDPGGRAGVDITGGQQIDPANLETTRLDKALEEKANPGR